MGIDDGSNYNRRYYDDGMKFNTIKNKEMYMKKKSMDEKYSRYESFPDDFYNPYPKTDSYPEQSFGPSVNSDLQKAEKEVDELTVELHQTRIDFQSAVVESECLKKDIHTQKQLLENANDEIKVLKAKVLEMQDFSRFDAMIIEEEQDE